MSILTLLFALGADTRSKAESGALTNFATRVENMPVGRQLTAARKTSQLKTRDISEILTYEQDLHYIDCTYLINSICRKC